MKTIFLFRLLATALLLIQRVEATYSQLPQATNNKVYTVVVVVVVVISWPFSLGLSSLLIIAQWGVLATRWRIAKKDKESFFKKPVFSSSFVVAAENAAKRRIECSCISYSFEKENRDIGAENTENPFFFFFPFDY